MAARGDEPRRTMSRVRIACRVRARGREPHASRVHAPCRAKVRTCVVPTHHAIHACRQAPVAPVSCSSTLHTLVHNLDISSSTHGASSVLSISISHFAFCARFLKPCFEQLSEQLSGRYPWIAQLSEQLSGRYPWIAQLSEQLSWIASYLRSG